MTWQEFHIKNRKQQQLVVYVWYETTAVIDIMQCLQPIDDIRMSKLDGSSCQGPEKTPAR